MKRFRLTYEEWKCILSKKQTICHPDNGTFRGYLSCIEIQQVSSPQIWTYHHEVTVCQDGFTWLTILPKDEYYCIMAVLDEKHKILLWYIDIIAGQGVDEDAIPYCDDLYLDLVVYPDGTIVEDDRNELEEAWKQRDITSEQYELANRTCAKLKEGLLADIKAFEAFTRQCMNQFTRCGDSVS